MVDESLVTLEDARQLVDAGACDLFNIRISKCGGLSNCLKLARTAEKAGLAYQLGAHIGETSVLSAAGRHLALSLPEVRFVEGSSGGFLLREDLSLESLQFEPGGKGRPLSGPGLGIDVSEEKLTALAIEHRLLGDAP
jgi:muconate cycloisomerase